MVPALFGEWATTLADAAGVGPGERVLDVACGTGVLTREVASRTGPAGLAAGVDANGGMLAAARRSWPRTVPSRKRCPFPIDRSMLCFMVLSKEQIAAILHEADTVLAPFLASDGRTAFTTSAHIGTGRRP
jgi:SAM-dependent methyltransferase